MKKKIICALALIILIPAALHAQEEENPGGWNFDVMGFTARAKVSYKPKSHTHRINFIGFSGWGFGLNAALAQPEGMSVEMGRSFHFFVSDLIGWNTKFSKRSSMSIGFGIDLKNFTMTGPTRFDIMPNRRVELAPYPDGALADYSRMRIFSTTYNIKYIQRIGRYGRFAIGPELYVVRAPGKRHEVRTQYTTADGQEIKEHHRNIRTNKAGLNLVSMLSYKGIFGLYVKYTPTHYLSSYQGPQFTSISTGVVLFGL